MYTSLKSANLFSIGTVSKSFGVSDNTIRRMEAAGLLTPAVVKESGYRYYDYDNITRIKTILTLRSFGLVYEDMREYFKNPGDFTLVYDKLYEKKLALDVLLSQAKLHLKPDDPEEVFLIPHKEIHFFAKKFTALNLTDIEIMEDISIQAFHDAVNKKYPVDYSRPVTIETCCTDMALFDRSSAQDVTVLVPLREKVDSSETYTMPSRKVVSIAYYYGLSLNDVFSRLQNYMEDNKLKQSGPISGTFEIGRHIDSNINKNNYLFHVMIPCEDN